MIRVDRAVLEAHQTMTAARAKGTGQRSGRVFGTHRPIRPIVRRRIQSRRHLGDHDPATRADGQLVRRTAGPNATPRVAGPDHHLERTPTPSAARRLHRPLQPAPPSPIPRSGRAGRHQPRHNRRRPTDPATRALRRTHQRIPPRCLTNILDASHDQPHGPVRRARTTRTRDSHQPTRPDRAPSIPRNINDASTMDSRHLQAVAWDAHTRPRHRTCDMSKVPRGARSCRGRVERRGCG
jgi:hypothetical protein